MEERPSGDEEVLLTRMRALARRGASLRREEDGTGTIEPTDRRHLVGRFSPQQLLRLLDAGWLRPDGHERYVITRRGVSALRAMLSRPSETGLRPSTPAGLRPSIEQRTSPTAPAAVPRQNLCESPLAWLRQRHDKNRKPLISAVEFEAGERLRADFEFAQLNPRVTASWDFALAPSKQPRGQPGTALQMADAVVAARQRVDAALKVVGPELASVLIDVCCFLQGLEQAERNGGWPRRSGKVVLQLALAHLARHYGLDRGRANGGRLRSWGANGYRPSIDGEGHEK